MKQKYIPYGKQEISNDDIQAVIETLQSDFITTGPKVSEFEEAVAKFADAKFAVAVSNGTAALHCAMFAIGIKEGDEVIVPTLTFAASANCVRYCGGNVVFADVKEDSLLVDPNDVKSKITDRTKAVIAVDYAGQPCDYDALRVICNKHDLFLITDACHSIGSKYKGKKTGSIADITCFSFHPVKHITTGEGGMSVTNDKELDERMRIFRNHGITTDYRQREEKGAHYYEMTELGYNYRITDFQCALGISQLKKLPDGIQRRQEIAAHYDQAFGDIENITPLKTAQDVSNAYHLYVIKLADHIDRDKVFCELRNKGIGVNVHYIPIHLHPYYQKLFKGKTPELQPAPHSLGDGGNSRTPELQNASLPPIALATGGTLKLTQCPVAEEAYKHIISLPMFPGLKDTDVKSVINIIQNLLQ